tara:strand:+ start:1788 stop:1997 length:210 start_codon:yes stop_codon:yes gene_type:complete
MIFSKHKKTLELVGNDVISHGNKIAELNRNTSTIHALAWKGKDTAKHIKYVSKELGFEIVKILVDGKEV